jgi:SAM-dependent methyltransferase
MDIQRYRKVNETQVFAPYVSHITAIDVDAGTIELYKSRIGELGEKHKNTHAAVGNLLADTEAPVGNDFDLITVGAALHAFPDAQDAVMCLADRLAPGGVLFVQDRFDDGEYGGRGPRGFTEDGMKTTMSNAGLVNLRFEVLPDKVEIEVMDGEVVGIWCFVARGVKPKGSGLEMEE